MFSSTKSTSKPNNIWAFQHTSFYKNLPLFNKIHLSVLSISFQTLICLRAGSLLVLSGILLNSTVCKVHSFFPESWVGRVPPEDHIWTLTCFCMTWELRIFGFFFFFIFRGFSFFKDPDKQTTIKKDYMTETACGLKRLEYLLSVHL